MKRVKKKVPGNPTDQAINVELRQLQAEGMVEDEGIGPNPGDGRMFGLVE